MATVMATVGWGVVVNEALCAQVPVLCSDRVGARAVVERFGAGSIYGDSDGYGDGNGYGYE